MVGRIDNLRRRSRRGDHDDFNSAPGRSVSGATQRKPILSSPQSSSSAPKNGSTQPRSRARIPGSTLVCALIVSHSPRVLLSHNRKLHEPAIMPRSRQVRVNTNAGPDPRVRRETRKSPEPRIKCLHARCKRSRRSSSRRRARLGAGSAARRRCRPFGRWFPRRRPPNRVEARLALTPPTPPGMRVRAGRFAQHSLTRR